MTSVAKNAKYGTAIRHFLLAAICVLLIPLYSHGDTKNGEQPDVGNTPIQKKFLKTIIVDDYYPYTFVNQNGDPDGFSVDLIRAIAREMGLELKIDVNTWDKARNALKDGDIDVLPMMAYSKERDQFFDFSVPHTIAYDAFFTRKNGSKILSLDDLHGKQIIVMKGDQAHDYLLSTELIGPEQLIIIDSLPDALRLLSSGKGDAALMPKLVGLIVAKNLKLSNLELSPIVIEAYNRPFSFAVVGGNQSLLEKLSQGLLIAKKSDQYSKIYEKWFGALEPPGLSLRTVLKYIGGIILVFIVIGSILLLWSFSLRKQVALRTRALEEEIAERRQAEEGLRESEEKYRSLVESTQDSIYVVNRTCNYLFMNRRHLSRLDVPENNATGKTYREFHSASDTQEFIKKVEEVFASDAPQQHEHESHRDGKHFLRTLSPIIGPDGRTEAVTVVSTDITDRVQAEEERLKLQDQLQRAQKMEAMGLMAGGVAHDLNNILSGIVSYPELLLMNLPEDSPLRKPLKTIQESGMRAADVVADLMTIARGVAHSKEVLNLNTMVEEYLESAEYRKLENTHPFVHFKTEPAPDLLNMSGSPIHIKKILMNLVTNASEAIEGAGTVTISSMNRYLDEPLKGHADVRTGEYAVLSVSDDGSGIAPKDLEKIFEPFYTKKVMGRSGTGLGLAVVWNTVQDHNGYINVKSSGNGTAFELYFPATRDEVTAEKKKVPLEDYLGHGEKILVVDDDERQREIACGMLTELAYNTEAVSSGEEAIEYLKEKQVDLIVLDMVMPKGINGRETYEEIIKICPGQKVIIASGFSETEEVKMARKSGAGNYIKKPYILEKIGLAVKEELEK